MSDFTGTHLTISEGNWLTPPLNPFQEIGVTGVQLLTGVRAILPHLPAIIWTGYSGNLRQANMDELKLSGILRKPFTLAEISKIVNDTLAMHKEDAHPFVQLDDVTEHLSKFRVEDPI